MKALPLLYASILITIISCTEKIEQVVIEPPFQQLTPTFNKFTVDISQGDTLNIVSGTQIIIPPYALTDSLGRLARGTATILYREYKDEIDVLLSGIPMDIEIAGESRQLQTAGMFELRALQGIVELGMAEDKKIAVKFATDVEGMDYNFFALDDSSGAWEFQDYSVPEQNEQRIIIKKKIKELTPSLKIPFDDHYFAMNYNSFIDVYFGDNYQLIRKNAHKSRYKNKAAAFGLKTYDLYGDQVNYRGNLYPAALMVWESVSGHRFPKWTEGRTCELTRIQASIYQLKVSDVKLGKSFALNARLVMPLKYLFRFSPKQWQDDYEETMAKIAIEEKRLAAEATVFRTMEVAGFGIYNFDRLRKQNDAIKILAKFEMKETIYNEAYRIKYVYGLPGDGKSVIKIDTEYMDEFYLDPTDSNFRFITVLPDDKIGVYPAWKYSHIDFEKLRNDETPSFTFVMDVQPRVIRSEEDLNAMLSLASN